MSATSTSAISRRRLIKAGLSALVVAKTSTHSTLPLASESRGWTVCETARENGRRLSFVDEPSVTQLSATVRVANNKVGPSLYGFGGALTESAAHVLSQLPKEKRAQVLRMYFDANEGIGYTLARTHMTSCDFSLRSWSLDDADGDKNLRKFSLAPMRDKLLPLIRDVQKSVGKDRFKLLASPWSPPAWMKTNGEMNHGGELRDDAKSAWAAYYVRFVQAMRDDEKIPVWAMTVQNEPDAAQPWESCLYSARDERDFVADFLGPALEKAKLTDVKLFGWDHNRSGLEERAAIMLGDSRSAKYLAGLALHWYQEEDFAASSRVLEQFPDKQILFTEGCVEGGPHAGEWEPAERYARNMIGDFTNGVCGFIDWNIALDMQGGPNHVGNFCHAPILVDTKSGDVHVQPSFYYIAHFSKYVRAGARRLTLESDESALQIIAFGNVDGSRVIIVANPTDLARDITIACENDVRSGNVPPHAIQTHIVTS